MAWPRRRRRRLTWVVLAVASVLLLVAAGLAVFGPRSTPPPGGGTVGETEQLMGWELTKDNTGLAALGLSCDVLPVYRGPDRPEAGTVIHRRRITSPLILAAGDITISESCVRPTTVWQGLPLLSTTDNDTGEITPFRVTIRDSDFDGSLLSERDAAFTLAFVGIADLYRNYVHDLGSGLALMNTGQTLGAVVEGNFVTALVAHGDAATGGNHSDGFTVRDFDTSTAPSRTLVVRRNRFDCSSGNDTGAFFVQTYAGDIDNLTVTGNLLEGLGYQLGLNADFGNSYRGVRAIDNRFDGRGYGPAYVQGGAGWDVWRENYLNNPGGPGNRGEIVAEP